MFTQECNWNPGRSSSKSWFRTQIRPSCQNSWEIDVVKTTKECPDHLWNLAFPWGMPQSLKEMKQALVGNSLLWVVLSYMLLVYAHGGCGTLEHPRGCAPQDGRFSCWISAMITRLLKAKPWQIVSFMTWKPQKLGGLNAQGGWKTSVAKEYPPRLCRSLSTAYLDHALRKVLLPPGVWMLHGVCLPISLTHMVTHKGVMMANEYHGTK